MTENAHAERRKFPRVAVDCLVRYRPSQAAKGARIREDRLMTLGEGGCFVQSKLTYPKDTNLDLRFDLEGHEFMVMGRVVYSIPFNPKVETVQFPGMGVQFVGAQDPLLQTIRKIVAREQLKAGLGVTE